MLIMAKETQVELNRIMGNKADPDFEESGDKLPF